MPGTGNTRTRLRVGGLLCVALFATTAAPAVAQQTVTLKSALSRTLSAEPTVQANQARQFGAGYGVAQAGRRLNPSIGVEAENFAGSGAYRNGRSTEATVFFEQKVELGGKREARTGVAASEATAVKARGVVALLDRLRDVELAYADALFADAQARVARERLSYARSIREEISRRAEAGREASFSLTRADAQVALDQLAVEQADAAARITRSTLGAFWKGSASFRLDPGAFRSTASTSPEEGSNPEIALLAAEREAAAARLSLAIANASPDPAFRVGVRRLQDTRDTAVIAGISIPLQIFDNNSAAIAQAQEQRRAAEFDSSALRMVVRREAMRLHQEMQAAAREAARVRSNVIPTAEKAVGMIRDGLERGGFSYVELADAQRLLNDAKQLEITTLKKFHTDRAALARLTGRHARAFNLAGTSK
ncbi:MAG: hypothetical protein DI565_12950 [Ancylobacter novellus]|uniref:TolC family protein n=1 Tax=Ancylobacter novellus TaxID=921 RepID=A0A2W5KBU0_ANCNO|nr:MAG: hypothetical protein DI565_12950 [Ancylobacter novellus]